ncbi:MAG TPA: TonB-dependent receptor [Thermoanaerobaculia bacterium]|jgi:outer membrane cobalamin receptor|nr:TonB-dependent receptor [Thermoanaerobaculia bacterium]
MRPAFLGLLLIAAAAGAQEPSETFYETATVQARPLSAATGSVTVIDRETIEASGARTVGDLLRLAPGVSVTTNGRGGFSAAQIRAGEPNFTLVLLDGVPLNDSTYQAGDVFNLEGLPTAGIERIEVVRGPLSSFYGSTGLAGVVQIFTHDGGKTGDGPEAQAEVSAGDASFRRGTGTVSGKDWSVTALWEEEAERIAEERFEQAGGLASFSKGRLELKARGAWWEGDDYPDASGGPVYGDGELRHSDHEELSLAAGLTLGERHRLDASVYRHAMDRESPAVLFAVPDAIEETRYTRTRLGWASVLRSSEALRWSAGMDVQREQGENESILAGFITGDYDITRTLPGAYTELIAGRGGWTFELGSRIDLPQDNAAQWSPRLGIARQIGKARLRASAGRAWKLPSFFALASPPALGGNPDLRPETVLGGDTGVEWRLDRSDAGLTLFYNRYEDLVDFDFETFIHLNRSEVETRGIEGTWGWKPRDGVSLRANATWQEFESEADLRHRPKWTGSLQARWQPVDALTLDLEAQAVSRFFDRQIPVANRRTVDGYELLGAEAAWRLAKPWELRLRLDNLLDERYETLIGFPGPERSVRAGLRWSS